MERYKLPLTGALIALGLLLGGMAIGSAIIGVMDMSRVVNVKGLSVREVPADKVIWPITYKEIGNNLTDLYNTINSKNKIIIDFLLENGISSDEIIVAAPEIVDLQAERYGNQNYAYRYNVTSIITVTSNKVSLVTDLMIKQADLIKKGVAIIVGSYEYRPTFSFTGLNDIKPEMIEEATINARTTALKFAADSESKLGKIKSANQGQFTINDRDSNTPQIKEVRVVTSVTYFLED
ncbi:MAG: SIMPL domain-containing protein [Bacteroidales bacterium]|nr:SIMPL domain-containing protein [Bacteroidales bacterium]MBQ7818288.1 SIMPL domain-containing protein [Bacteroidales bacterium]